MLVRGEISVWFFKYAGFFHFMDPGLVICISSIDQRRKTMKDPVERFCVPNLEVGDIIPTVSIGWIFLLFPILWIFVELKVRKWTFSYFSRPDCSDLKNTFFYSIPHLKNQKLAISFLSLVFLLLQVESLLVLLLRCSFICNSRWLSKSWAELVGIPNFAHNFLKIGKIKTLIINLLKYYF